MRLHTLRIDGFKSFADPVDVPLRPGLTGVIGPNGAGKSNVTEAVRWVMGASSARQLRGQDMASVVFAGTGPASARGWGRPARTSAEVVLEGERDGQPFEVSRRVAIGADEAAVSTYRVDGEAALARDVRTLFATAGTGPASPALVQQMRIAALVSGSPGDRRSLLDQAAGITGLNAHRRQAEVQLDAVDRELTHQAVLMDALRQQAEGLTEQVEAAERHAELTRTAERAQVAATVLRLQEAAAATEAATARLVEAQATADAARSEGAAATAERDALRREQETARAAADEAACLVADLTAQLAAVDAERSQAAAECRRLGDLVQTTTRALERERQLAEDADAQADTARAKLDEAEREHASVADDDHKDALDAAEDAVRAARAASVEATRQLVTAEAEARASTTTAERAADELEGAREAHVAATAAAEAAAARPGPDRDALDQTVRDAAAAVEAARRARDEAEADRRDATCTNEDVRARVRTLARRRDGLTDEIGALRTLIQDADGRELVQSCEVQDGYEGALSAALGDGLLAGTDRSAARYWDTASGDAAPALCPTGDVLIPLSDVVSVPPALVRAVGAVAVAGTEAAAEAARDSLLPGQSIVTVEGGLWRWDGYVVRPGTEDIASRLLARRARYNALTAERTVLLADYDAAKAASMGADDRVREAEEAAATTRERTDAADRTLRQAEQARSGALTAADEADRERRRATQAVELAAARRDRAEAAHEADRAAAADVPDTDGLRQAAEDASATLERVERDRAEAAAVARAAGERAHVRGARLRELRAALSDWEGRAERGRVAAAEQGAALTEAKVALAEMNQVPGELAVRRGQLDADLRAAAEEREEAGAALIALQADLAAATVRADEASAAAITADRTLDQARAGGVTATRRFELLRDDVTRTHGTADPDELLHDAGLTPDDLLTLDAYDRQAAAARTALGKLSRVNPVAADDLAAVQAKLDQAEAQTSDVSAAGKALRDALGRLREEGRSRLLEAFEAIEKNFRAVYGALFEGGQARLELEGDDPLDAGLEVMASPAGKRLTALSLLSGGEQALTATALVCAAILTRPSPIVVLDEVDAPLDGPNIERFCQLLRMVSDTSGGCFLVVTHDARTISAMDQLLTVEMPEAGVSSVRLVELTGGTAAGSEVA